MGMSRHMYVTLIRNDIRKGKLIAVTVAVFIAASAALTALAAALGVHLFGAMDRFLEDAKALHFMQMHTGDIDEGNCKALRTRRAMWRRISWRSSSM